MAKMGNQDNYLREHSNRNSLKGSKKEKTSMFWHLDTSVTCSRNKIGKEQLNRNTPILEFYLQPLLSRTIFQLQLDTRFCVKATEVNSVRMSMGKQLPFQPRANILFRDSCGSLAHGREFSFL